MFEGHDFEMVLVCSKNLFPSCIFLMVGILSSTSSSLTISSLLNKIICCFFFNCCMTEEWHHQKIMFRFYRHLPCVTFYVIFIYSNKNKHTQKWNKTNYFSYFRNFSQYFEFRNKHSKWWERTTDEFKCQKSVSNLRTRYQAFKLAKVLVTLRFFFRDNFLYSWLWKL